MNRAVSTNRVLAAILAAALGGAPVASSCVQKLDFTDADGDGVDYSNDCNDHNAGINPDGAETPGNGVDDDCSGQVDQPTPTNDWDQDGVSEEGGDCNDQNPDVGGLQTYQCDTGKQGICAAGTWKCIGGIAYCVPNMAEANEICNLKDDNCDGFIDEGDPGGGAWCDTGAPGECSNGIWHCVDGTKACVQAYAPMPDICNTLDDDCDNSNDEPVPEICNGIDDDCDGAPDDGCPCQGDQWRTCTGPDTLPCAAGIMQCTNGNWGPCIGTIGPSSEACQDGVDNDCDGAVDAQDLDCFNSYDLPDITLYPLALIGGSDGNFTDNGPIVYLSVDLWTTSAAIYATACVTMTETDNNCTKGRICETVSLPIPNGGFIPTQDQHFSLSYIDTDEAVDDAIYEATEPSLPTPWPLDTDCDNTNAYDHPIIYYGASVIHATCMGRTDDNDIGVGSPPPTDEHSWCIIELGTVSVFAN